MIENILETLLMPNASWDSWLEWRKLMRVEDAVVKTAVFIGTESGGRFTASGTATIVGVPHKGMCFQFLATARHVLDRISGNTVSVRLNRRSGGCDVISVTKVFAHPTDLAIDIALVPINVGLDIYDIIPLPLDDASLDVISTPIFELGAGEEISIIGLYTTHIGESRNIPVVRIGHIAVMPGEKIRTSHGAVRGYLVEVHSIAGLSGSPVFHNVPQVAVINNELKHLNRRLYYPIGIFIGYHVIQSRETEMIVPEYDGDEFEVKKMSMDERRTGFGVVVPIQELYAITKSASLCQLMDAGIEERNRQSGFKPA